MTVRPDDTTEPSLQQAASTGIEGLDRILRGGFPRDGMHLIQGAAGTGKTTLALQYLLTGVRAGESGTYITLTQTGNELEAIAHSHGWSLEGVTVHEMSPGDLVHSIAAHQTVLHTAEVELSELTRDLRRLIEQARPRRVVFDALGVIRLLAGTTPRYHQEVVTLRRFLAGQGSTALFLDDGPTECATGGPNNSEFHNLATSIVHLEQTAPAYGEPRRRVRVIKVRGVPFQGGYHNYRIRTGGLEVYPRLGSSPGPAYNDFRLIRSGIEVLDQMLGGGLEQGTACLLIGPPGTGKSTLAAVYAHASTQSGDSSAIFLFEERPETFKLRSKRVGFDLQPQLDSGRLSITRFDAADISPGEFSHRVREAVEDRKVRVVVIDSLTGYFNAMGNTPMLVLQMHELLTFLSRHGVLTFLLVAQEEFMTLGPRSSVDVSYLSDSIILLRMFESGGAIRRCLTAVKKRQGEHEMTIRELFIHPGEVTVGKEPLRQFRYLLNGEAEPAHGQSAGGDNPAGEEEP